MTVYGPQRVVSLQPSATVVLAALGKLDSVVACTKHCAVVVPEVKSSGKIIVEDSWTAQASQIKATNPDLVIASVPYQEQAVIEILKSGVRFLGFAPKNLADVYNDIQVIAGVMNVPERGRQIIEEMQREIEEIRAKAQVLPKVRVFCEEWGKPLIHSQKWVQELVAACGGEFIGLPGAHTTADAVVAADPDVIVAAWCGAGDRVPLEKIVRDRNWPELRAVREGRVYCICDDFLNTPAPTLLKGLRALAAAIHPGCFPHVPGLRWINQ